jgi:putative flippase GtrA
MPPGHVSQTAAGPPSALSEWDHELSKQLPADPVRLGLLRQARRFTGVGLACTAGYTGLYLSLSRVVDPQLANAVAQLLAAVANTALNRRVTFGVTGADGALTQHMQGLVVFGLGLALSGGTLGALDSLPVRPTPVTELAALTAANLVATLLRFVLLRSWIFRH